MRSIHACRLTSLVVPPDGRPVLDPLLLLGLNARNVTSRRETEDPLLIAAQLRPVIARPDLRGRKEHGDLPFFRWRAFARRIVALLLRFPEVVLPMSKSVERCGPDIDRRRGHASRFLEEDRCRPHADPNKAKQTDSETISRIDNSERHDSQRLRSGTLVPTSTSRRYGLFSTDRGDCAGRREGNGRRHRCNGLIEGVVRAFVAVISPQNFSIAEDILKLARYRFKRNDKHHL